MLPTITLTFSGIGDWTTQGSDDVPELDMSQTHAAPHTSLLPLGAHVSSPPLIILYPALAPFTHPDSRHLPLLFQSHRSLREPPLPNQAPVLPTLVSLPGETPAQCPSQTAPGPWHPFPAHHPHPSASLPSFLLTTSLKTLFLTPPR